MGLSLSFALVRCRVVFACARQHASGITSCPVSRCFAWVCCLACLSEFKPRSLRPSPSPLSPMASRFGAFLLSALHRCECDSFLFTAPCILGLSALWGFFRFRPYPEKLTVQPCHLFQGPDLSGKFARMGGAFAAPETVGMLSIRRNGHSGPKNIFQYSPRIYSSFSFPLLLPAPSNPPFDFNFF